VTGAEGSVMPKPASALTASYVSSAIITDLSESDNVIAYAKSMIHKPGADGRPRLGQDAVTTLSGSTTEDTIGYVFAKLKGK
jgi:hypothetical protein